MKKIDKLFYIVYYVIGKNNMWKEETPSSHLIDKLSW